MLRLYRFAKAGCFFCIGLPMAIFILVSLLSERHRQADEINRYRSRATISMTEFSKLKQPARWYRITDVVTNAGSAAYLTESGSDPDTEAEFGGITRVIVPAASRQDAIHVVKPRLALITRDDQIRKVLHELENVKATGDPTKTKSKRPGANKGAAPKTDDAVDRWIDSNLKQVVQVRTIDGLVKPNAELSDEEKKLYDDAASKLAPDCLVLIENAKPEVDDSGNTVIVIMIISIVFGVLAGGAYLYLGLTTRA